MQEHDPLDARFRTILRDLDELPPPIVAAAGGDQITRRGELLEALDEIEYDLWEARRAASNPPS